MMREWRHVEYLFLDSTQLLQPHLIKMIDLILTKNNSTFKNEHYLQIKGTAMGTRMAPSYANLFIAHLETRLLLWTSDVPYIW